MGRPIGIDLDTRQKGLSALGTFHRSAEILVADPQLRTTTFAGHDVGHG
jgi:hypothetical protein